MDFFENIVSKIKNLKSGDSDGTSNGRPYGDRGLSSWALVLPRVSDTQIKLDDRKACSLMSIVSISGKRDTGNNNSFLLNDFCLSVNKLKNRISYDPVQCPVGLIMAYMKIISNTREYFINNSTPYKYAPPDNIIHSIECKGDDMIDEKVDFLQDGCEEGNGMLQSSSFDFEYFITALLIATRYNILACNLKENKSYKEANNNFILCNVFLDHALKSYQNPSGFHERQKIEPLKRITAIGSGSLDNNNELQQIRKLENLSSMINLEEWKSFFGGEKAIRAKKLIMEC